MAVRCGPDRTAVILLPLAHPGPASDDDAPTMSSPAQPPRGDGSNKNKRNRRGRRRGAPPGAEAPPAADASPNAAPEPGAPRLEGPPGIVLERLRDRIRDVVREVDSLRAENQRLSQQVATLQQQAGAGDPALLRLDESPEALRSKVEAFIDALDTYLDEEAP